MNDRLKTALTIAGSDPGGGAGLQADLRVFNSLGVYGLSVVTAITAQNTAGVSEISPLSASEVHNQLEAVLGDMPPLATKTGMLATAEVVKEVALIGARGKLGRLVVDPVLTSTSGDDLAEEGLGRELSCDLIPLCELVTPNIDEASRLTGVEIHSVHDVKEAALAMAEMEAKAVCVTGGHLRGDPVDILYDGREFIEFRGRRLGALDEQFHGTGCLFSAAVAAGLAGNMELAAAVASAKKAVESAIARAVSPGKGMKVPWPEACPDLGLA